MYSIGVNGIIERFQVCLTSTSEQTPQLKRLHVIPSAFSEKGTLIV